MNNRRLMAYLLLTAAYVASGKLGLMLALPPGYASPIFPPAGIAVAAAFIGGRRTLPWILLGSLLLNIWVGYSAHHQVDATGFIAASAIAAASMLQAALGGWWLRRVIGYPTPLDHGRDILHFLLLAPVICVTSASLSVSGLLALGIVDAASFAANWAAWWVGDTLGVVVMLPLVMIAAGEPRALWQSRVRTIAVPMLLIFTLFVVIFLRTNKWEYADSLSEFRQVSQQAVNQVQTQLEAQEYLLEQMTGLFIHDERNNHVSREEFHRFTERSLARFPAIQALEWAPRVDAAHRASFEAEQRKDFPGFEISERNTAGQLQRAGGRTQFYPVTYVEPLAGNESALGFDLVSTPDRQAALTEAVKRGIAVATPPVRLVQGRQEQAGVLLLLAVKTGGNESGVVLTVLRMDDFMDKLLPATRSMLYARLIDLDGQKTLYDSFAPGNQKALYERTFNFGTRHYRLETAPTPAYFMQHHGWQSWSVLASGILGTGLFGALLLLGTAYTARVEAQVKDRTRMLKESESRFRSTLEHAPIGMAVASLDGRFVQVNYALCAILGYEKEELEKLTFGEITHPEDIASTLASVQRLLDGEINSYRLEKRYIRKDGQPIWTQLTASIERDESGAPLYFIGQIEDITERKRAEEELKLSAQLLNSTSDSVFLLDLDGNFVYLNEAAWKSRGYTRDEMMGMNLRELNAPEYNKLIAPRMKALMENGQGSFESAHRCKDGSVMPVEINARVTESGGRKLLLSVIRDITERKRVEGVLRDSEEQYRTMVESSNDMIWALAPDGKFTFINQQAADVTGRSIEDWLGKTFEPLVLEEDMPMVLEVHGKVMGGEKVHYEVRGKKADGGILTLFVNASPIFTGGKVSGTISFASDITERKLAEEKLLKSEVSLRAILDNSPYIAWLKDTAGRFIAVNEAFFKTTGQQRMQDVLGKTDLDFWPRELAEKYRADDARIMATRQKMLTEEPSIMEDGKIHWVETFKTPILDENGQLLGTTGFARDITERKAFEEELKRSNTELEQFSYAVSHDMRQPLRMISSYLQLIEINLADQLDSEKRDYLDFAIDGAKRLDQMLVALLEYSRVGRKDEPPTWIESHAVLDEALLFLQPTLAEAQARLDISGDWPRIFANRDEILRLLQNLIGNAAKFRVAGRTAEITVTSKMVKNKWHLCVADNGVGIIPDQVKRLFQVFQRLHSREAYEGTGIGLALCRKIAEHYKGRIWAESAGEGQGSKFYVVLPVPREGGT